jgi:hypothetical protein
MQHAPSLEFLQRELRSQICRRCYLRPPGSRSRSPDAARACESRCAIFATLPSVRRIGEYLDPMVEPYETALQHLYREVCGKDASASVHCAPDSDRRALRRYQHRVIEVLAAILNRSA